MYRAAGLEWDNLNIQWYKLSAWWIPWNAVYLVDELVYYAFYVGYTINHLFFYHACSDTKMLSVINYYIIIDRESLWYKLQSGVYLHALFTNLNTI